MTCLRRRAILLVTSALLVAPIPLYAQSARKPYRIGLLVTDKSQTLLQQNLRDLGYVEGRDVVYEIRSSDGRSQRLDDFALELVRLNVDVIVSVNPAGVISAKRATASIPIVMTNTPDPVELGLVSSLARPGGNITGTTTLSVDVSVKQLELLKQAVPNASRVVMLWNPESPWHARTVRALQRRSGSLGLQLRGVELRDADAFDSVFQTMETGRAQALLALADPVTFFHRRRLADLAIKHRLPMMGSLAGYAEAGSLLSYWPETADLFRRAASYIDRIFKGAKPADLPIEQPTKFELVANLKTAKALGIALPQSVLVRVDRVVE
jgi:putative ABC transport system substrate-binding protein